MRASSFSALEEFELPIEISENLLNSRIFRENDRMDEVINALRSGDLTKFGRGIFERNIIKDFQAGIAISKKNVS
jgi:galactokinase